MVLTIHNGMFLYLSINKIKWITINNPKAIEYLYEDVSIYEVESKVEEILGLTKKDHE